MTLAIGVVRLDAGYYCIVYVQHCVDIGSLGYNEC